MKIYATHDAQMAAFLAEPCPNCCAARSAHQQVDATTWGFCPLTGCRQFGESEHIEADDYMQIPNEEVSASERTYARSRTRRRA